MHKGENCGIVPMCLWNCTNIVLRVKDFLPKQVCTSRGPHPKISNLLALHTEHPAEFHQHSTMDYALYTSTAKDYAGSLTTDSGLRESPLILSLDSERTPGRIHMQTLQKL